MAYALLVLIGFIAGTVGSLAGLGGGVIIVPSLLFFGALGWLSAVTPQVAVGTSLVVIIFNGLSSTLSYMKDKMVDYQSGLLFCLGSVPGAVIGAWVNNTLSAAHFSLYFGLFLIAMSVFLSLSQKKTKRSADETAAAKENGAERTATEQARPARGGDGVLCERTRSGTGRRSHTATSRSWRLPSRLWSAFSAGCLALAAARSWCRR
ncbi:Sulfite exporter TauE/SafE [Geobacillus sp. BCO2]|nr:Sulfite exporter TauE/SafE [Geobacillus sp. BCO2]